MLRRSLLAMLLAGGVIVPLETELQGGEENVIERKIDGHTVRMMLTGSAVRTKAIFKVYSIDSYMEEGVKVRTADDMIQTDRPKQLHLVMLRSVGGAEMADAF